MKEMKEKKIMATFFTAQMEQIGKTFYEIQGIIDVIKENTSINYLSLVEK